MFSFTTLAICFCLAVGCLFVYWTVILPRYNPLRTIPGPPLHGIYNVAHMSMVTNPALSPRAHAQFVQEFGRNVHIRGPFPWDDRLLTLDPLAISHVLKNTSIYQKPWQTRAMISTMIGTGILFAEGDAHKRFRKLGTAAFTPQHIHVSKAVIFQKALNVRRRWLSLLKGGQEERRLDVCDWICRATFDVIGKTGFDYEFNAVDGSEDELYLAYNRMFEVGVTRHSVNLWGALILQFPFLSYIYTDERTRTIAACRATIERVAGGLLREKKRLIVDSTKENKLFHGKDLLTLMLQSNLSPDIPPAQRHSDEEILNNISTYLFAGTDTTGMGLTWTLLLLAMYPDVQTRLRNELLSICPSISLETLSAEDIQSLFDNSIANLQYLDNVIKESLRLIPPIHSTIRCATQVDIIPTSSPMKFNDGGRIIESRKDIKVLKGTAIHIPIEGLNLDKEYWGHDAWNFNPDRWDDLPETVTSLPSPYAGILSFSAGPRFCLGQKFAIAEMKIVLFILVSHFVFRTTGEKLNKSNVVLTKPYLSDMSEGAQLPLFVSVYDNKS
ncbi:cytochrome P450 [Abortiporus biennis]|nr:cytochrome P450 [Abortiporus biennis]